MVHGQAVDHSVTHGEDPLGLLTRWMVPGQIVQEKVLDAVGGEVKQDRCAPGDQPDQHAENDRARQHAPVEFFQGIEEDVKVGHGYRACLSSVSDSQVV